MPPHAPPVTLAALAARVRGDIVGDGAVVVTSVHHDSRKVTPGSLFVARRGESSDGLAFTDNAVERGAVAVLAQRDHAPQHSTVPVMLVDDIRIAMAQGAELVYGTPSQDLTVFGITGTNGKTTTTWLVEHALESAGWRPGVLGTFGAHFGSMLIETGFNTPEADELSRVAAGMRDAGATHLLMEMTSIALHQKRTDGLRIQVAAFTNLTQEHLDYHRTMAAYGAAKARLFDALRPERAVVMVDDDFGAGIADRLGDRALRVSRHAHAKADIRPACDPTHSLGGLRCEVVTPAGRLALSSPMFGQHNLANLLLALGSCHALGLDVHAAAHCFASCPAAPGRLERCDGPDDDIVAFVDYAHTPDGLDQMLAAVRAVADRRLWCVFACGGDRDRTKRGPMGAATERGCDMMVVTSDNPRMETPEAIAEAIVAGRTGRGAALHVELDRVEAIRWAVREARPGDVVVVAGKGHETTYHSRGVSIPFDDRVHLRAALANRRGGT